MEEKDSLSETIEGTPTIGLRAGNTHETLAPKGVLPSAEDLDAVAADVQAAQGTGSAQSVSDTAADAEESGDPLDHENTFDVSRAEFSELQDAFLRLEDRIARHNQGAPHKI